MLRLSGELGVLSAVECPGDISHGSAWLPGTWLIPGLEVYQLGDLLARRTAQSLLPGGGSGVFLGGVEGSWRSFLYRRMFA